jgi:hypothetical protein
MMISGFNSGVPRLATLIGLTAVVTSSVLVAAPAALARTAHATPAISQVQLSSGHTKVTSSTHRKLHVDLLANQTPGSTADDVVVSLSEAGIAGEEHDWTFPVAASALQVSSAGKGTLKVPSAKISPFGQISLTITPTGTPKTDSCDGTPSDKVQKVKLAGTFYFDTKSTGSQKWGAVGSRSTKKKAKKFTFSSTNDVTWFYLLPPSPDAAAPVTGPDPDCGGGGDDDLGLPCNADLIWDDASGNVDLTGVSVAGLSLIEASRNTQLSTPAGATREDDLTGTGPTPQFTTTPDPASEGASDASLVVTAATGAVGTTTIASSTSTAPEQLPCEGSAAGETANVSFWQDCNYTNGTTPLTVPAEIFGPISQTNNAEASIFDVIP